MVDGSDGRGERQYQKSLEERQSLYITMSEAPTIVINPARIVEMT
jgi:hypothetical protein